MKAAGMVTIILATAGLMLWASLSTAEQPTAGGTASIEKETSAGSGSSGTATQRGKAKKKRRSSGKQITEET